MALHAATYSGLQMLQVGQLYVWGLLSWLTPSSSMFQSMESSSWLHWMYSQPMYIANTGGATGGLPITRPPSFAIPDSEGRRWVSILCMPFEGQCKHFTAGELLLLWSVLARVQGLCCFSMRSSYVEGTATLLAWSMVLLSRNLATLMQVRSSSKQGKCHEIACVLCGTNVFIQGLRGSASV